MIVNKYLVFVMCFKDLRQAIHKKWYDLNLISLNNYTLIIYGKSLKHAFSDDLKMDFLKLCINCKSVICCRISSKQKAEVLQSFLKLIFFNRDKD